MSRHLLLSAALAALLAPAAADAAMHCVNTAAQLIAALDTAGDNGEADEIRIMRGTYYGTLSAPFSLHLTEPHGVAITGGWGAMPGFPGCVLRSRDASRTTLDGSGSVNVLWVTVSVQHHIVPITIETLSLRNGASTVAGSLYGSGLTVDAALDEAATIVVDNVILHGNVSTHFATPVVGLSSAEHSIRFSNSIVRHNTTADAPAVRIGSHNGSSAANGLTVIYNSRSGSAGAAIEWNGLAPALLNASLVWGNSGGAADLVENPRVRYTDTRYGSFGGSFDAAWHVGTSAVVDPLLQAPTVPRPLAASPLRNAASGFSGVGLYDVFGAGRKLGGTVDIGAAEFIE